MNHQTETREELYERIREIDFAMMTTVRRDGKLVSRPMSTQEVDDQGRLWFMTTAEADKLDEIANDSRVNLAYFDGGSKAWVSVAGSAEVTTDRDRIHELWSEDWRFWLTDEGGQRDGGKDDPRIVLISVEISSALHFDAHGKARQLWEFAKSMVTGDEPEFGQERRVDG